MNQEGAGLFTRLAPVLNVRDLAAERAFYEKLGLPVIYEGRSTRTSSASEPTRCTSASRKPPADNDPPSVLTWQIGVTDIDAAIQRCRSAGISFD